MLEGMQNRASQTGMLSLESETSEGASGHAWKVVGVLFRSPPPTPAFESTAMKEAPVNATRSGRHSGNVQLFPPAQKFCVPRRYFLLLNECSLPPPLHAPLVGISRMNRGSIEAQEEKSCNKGRVNVFHSIPSLSPFSGK